MTLSSIIFPNDKNPYHIKSLDGLRGLAVLIVILSHLSNNNIFLLPFLNFSTIGKYGVYLFFVLSSYLLDKQIVRALVLKKTSSYYWANYSLRRFLRIIPLFTLVLLINYFLTKNNISWAISLSFDELINHLTFQQGKDIFWSIPVEFKYYIISPLLMYLSFKLLKWQLKKIILFILLIIITSVVLNFKFHLNELSLIKYLPLFLFGSLIAIIEETQPKIVLKLKNHKQLFDVFGLVCLIILIILIPFYFNIIFQANIKHFHHYFLFSFFCISVVYGVNFSVVWKKNNYSIF